jgi:fibronectin type 3 domain-containing protein
VAVQFAPTSAGSATGTLTITSDATGSPTTVALSGTGATPVQHSVSLSWAASTSTVAGYNVYRSTVSGQSYVRVNGSVVTSLSYKDSTVQSGTTYFYVTTAVDSSGNESVFSNQVSATIP